MTITTRMRMHRARLRLVVTALGSSAALHGAPASARPQAPTLVCETYPDAAACRGRAPNCALCHTSTAPVAWNDFGTAVLGALAGAELSAGLPQALAQIADGDADGDGVSNEDELLVGTSPADPAQAWCAEAADGSAAPRRRASGYDLDLAQRRVMALFCGTAPSYEERQAFAALPDDDARARSLHARLDACLASRYWRDEALPRLADAKIQPVYVLGPESPAGVTLGDYRWDYRLFVWALTGGRDARDLLLATYHVRAASDGTLERIDGVLPGDIVPPPTTGSNGGQPLQPELRAGMITTQWFLAYNTLLSALPRITAAQAYRAYLDLDIARLDGIRPVAAEPADVDDRGVDEPACAVCHSTLDPLSYAFAEYEGVGALGLPPGVYNPGRPERVLPGWTDPPSWLLGREVDSVRAWASVAADSREFQQMLGRMFFAYAYGRDPTGSELADYDACWSALPESGWSANALIHCIVDLPTFATGGVP